MALQRDINELSLTGKVVSRTRKAKVTPDRTLRSAQAVRVRFSPAEHAFYDSVANLVRAMGPDLFGWGQTLAALQWFRSTASCVPAAAARFKEKLEAGLSIIKGIASDFDESSDDGNGGPVGALGESVRTRIEEIGAALDRLTEEDTKYDRLRETLDRIWHEDEAAGRTPRKVVLFAYFKPTLSYLDARQMVAVNRVLDGIALQPCAVARHTEMPCDCLQSVLPGGTLSSTPPSSRSGAPRRRSSRRAWFGNHHVLGHGVSCDGASPPHCGRRFSGRVLGSWVLGVLESRPVPPIPGSKPLTRAVTWAGHNVRNVVKSKC